MVTIISNELLKDLNSGKTINIEVGPLGLTLASEKWVEKMQDTGNIKEQNNNNTKSPCCYCKSDMASCCGCSKYFEWKAEHI